MEWSSNPQELKYIVKDSVTDKYLGVITLGSDVMSLNVEMIILGGIRKVRLRRND